MFWIFLTYIIIRFVLPRNEEAYKEFGLDSNASDVDIAKAYIRRIKGRLEPISERLFKIIGAILLTITLLATALLVVAIYLVASKSAPQFFMETECFYAAVNFVNTYGLVTLLHCASLALIPLGYLIYLSIVLLVGKRPKWSALLTTAVVWIILLLNFIFINKSAMWH